MQEGTTCALRGLTEREECEAQEAIRRGDGERVTCICRGAEQIAQALSPPCQPSETVRRIVESRECFERMAEACFPAVRPQDSWTFQTASVSWGVFAE
jgi:hypothetical protein